MEESTRHASWLELFFDLVVVAAVVQLAHRLHGDPKLTDIATFAALYLAVWMAWMSFTLYANVAGDRTRHRSMMAAMFGIAVMAAAVPLATGSRADIFAGAYVVGLFGTDLAAPVLTWLVAAIVGGQVALAAWDDRRRARDLKIG